MSKVVRVLWPYASYDFGNSIPVVNDVGTEVTDDQYEQILDLISDMIPKSRPQIEIVVGGVDTSPDELLPATRGWVEDYVASIGGDDEGGIALAAHIADESPHPAYDDIPSLVLLFENGIA